MPMATTDQKPSFPLDVSASDTVFPPDDPNAKFTGIGREVDQVRWNGLL
jgi:hypothetical protein